MTLTPEQQLQVDRQIAEHRHKKYTVDLILDDLTLKDFIVHPDILRPEVMVATKLAQLLTSMSFANLKILDIGCGSGLQGIVTAFRGAKQVAFSDISPQAIANTEESIQLFGMDKVSRTYTGDLFESVPGKFDIIIFNHPFFPSAPAPDQPVSRAMLDEGDLLPRFLQDAKRHLNSDGRILMPYYSLAGKVNNPLIRGPKHGYTAELLVQDQVGHGLQKGKFFVCRLTLA